MKNVNSEELKALLKKNIRSERLNQHITQDELAEKADISIEFLQAIEAGSKLGSLTTFVNLCIALGVTPNTLLYEVFLDNNVEIENLALKLNKLNKRDKHIIINLIDNMLNYSND